MTDIYIYTYTHIRSTRQIRVRTVRGIARAGCDIRTCSCTFPDVVYRRTGTLPRPGRERNSALRTNASVNAPVVRRKRSQGVEGIRATVLESFRVVRTQAVRTELTEARLNALQLVAMPFFSLRGSLKSRLLESSIVTRVTLTPGRSSGISLEKHLVRGGLVRPTIWPEIRSQEGPLVRDPRHGEQHADAVQRATDTTTPSPSQRQRRSCRNDAQNECPMEEA